MSDLAKSVRAAGDPWDGNPYYANAEKLTHIFWGERTLFRQLFQELELDVVLELACGHGRHSFQIMDRAKTLILMDIHDSNVEVSRSRLAAHSDFIVLKNNGYDFQPVADESLSSIFCYDAMVHVAPDVVASYLEDTARVLKAGGKALYHHSNLTAPSGNTFGQNPGARNRMTQHLFQSLAVEYGLCVLQSVVIPWGGVPELDCVTLLQKPPANLSSVGYPNPAGG